MQNRKPTAAEKFAAISLGIIMGFASALALPAESVPASKTLKLPTKLPPVVRERNHGYQADILLVMPNAKVEDDNIKKAMQEADGEVIGTMGEGALKVLIVKTEKGKLVETERKLRKDAKEFRVVQRNYYHSPQLVPNDPQFPSEWHLPAVNAQKAWDITQGAGQKVAVFDSGCQKTITDLSGKTDKGYDAHTVQAHAMALAAGLDPLGTSIGMAIDDSVGSGGGTDLTGHGTLVATTSSASFNNSNNGAGVAPKSTVVPIHITDDGTAMGDDLSVMAGLLNIMITHKAKIVNISYSNMCDPNSDPAMHAYFWTFHHVYGGLIFVSAGNDTAFLPAGQMDYLQVVSAVDPSLAKADFSNWGNCVKFTAPGVNIVLTDRTGASVTVNGTSFAAPICAGIAALVWSKNPGLSNDQVVSKMKATAVRPAGGAWHPFFGFGMPDAFAAVNAAG